MPIIEIATEGSPLTQGDILHGIELYHTSSSIAEGQYEVKRTDAKACLVLSRPCVAIHKKQIVVAAIVKSEVEHQEINDFDKCLRYFTHLRDGTNTPDVFQLGMLSMSEFSGRFCAKFDLLHTIEVPQHPDRRNEYIAKHRIARLNKEFVRDLHTRQFAAFSHQGFDDVKWFSNEDLTTLIGFGESEIRQINLNHDQDIIKSGSVPANLDQLTQVKDRKIAALVKRMIPFKEECERRGIGIARS